MPFERSSGPRAGCARWHFRLRLGVRALVLALALLVLAPREGSSQRLMPVGVVRLAHPESGAANLPERSNRDRLRRAGIGFVGGAALGAAAAYLVIHSGISGPGKDRETYAFFIPFCAVGMAVIAVFGP